MVKLSEVLVIKKDGTRDYYSSQKVINAVQSSAVRVMINFTENELKTICKKVASKVTSLNSNTVEVTQIHNIVESVLEELYPEVAKSYRDYRNYKTNFVHMLDKVYKESQRIMYLGDKENANVDSALVSTKRSLIFNELNKELYKNFFLNVEELQAIKDGYIYIHDMSARRDTMNCCLFDVATVLKGGFEMGNIWYNEPQSLDVAFDVIGDIVLASASQQYGGFTVPEIDKLLAPYAKKSFDRQYQKYLDLGLSTDKAYTTAMKDLTHEYEQGFQGWEYKFNTVASSRGDYPFITVTTGLGTSTLEKLATKICLQTRANGQGKKGFKKPVLFPKIVFLYDENLHGKGKPSEDLFKEGIKCSSKTMYPDWLSLTGEGYVASMYKKYKKVVSPMGCVDGKEVVTYRYNGLLYVESISRMWNRVSEDFKPELQVNNRDYFIIPKNLEVYDTQKGFITVKCLNRNTQSNWLNIRTFNGRYITCTEDHPFHTERGRILAKDLRDTDKLHITSVQYSENKDTMSLEEAWLLGFMLCDGYYNNHAVVASIAGVGEDDIEVQFKSCMSKVFKQQVYTKLMDRRSTGKGYYKDLKILSDRKGNLKNLIKYFTEKFGGIQKIHRHIPPEIFRSSRDIRLSFLAGMVDADGYIDDTSKQKYPTLQLGSTNRELALQEMALIQSLGIPVKFYALKYGSGCNLRYMTESFITSDILSHIVCNKKKSKISRELCNQFEFPALTRIKDIIPFKAESYCYDMTTESDYFDVSGIHSHNCRAFLSPWYERGGMEPADENDVPVFVGRFNIGAISLHLPMILAKARKENKDFYRVLDYYLELIRQLHIRTYNYLAEMRASINPLAYCEGGFYGGHLDIHDKIRPILKSSTASFGITALNELQELYNGKSLVQDNSFALEVMKYIKDKLEQYKKADNILYAIYGTPAERLCFSGDTEIQCYPKNKVIKDIEKGDLVYSVSSDGEIELKPVINSKLTNSNAVVLKVNFDNGQSIICTPNHPIGVRKMLQDPVTGQLQGEVTEYVQAKDLKEGMRIRSNYITINSHGRPECSMYFNRHKQLIHNIVTKYFLGEKPEGYVVHHKDYNKCNNLIENLEYLRDDEHRRIHQDQNIKKFRYTKGSQLGENNSFYGKRHSSKALNANRKAHIKDSVEQFTLDMKHLRHFECIQDTKDFKYTEGLVREACRGSRKFGNPHEYKDSIWYYTSDCKDLLEINHKVVSVEYLQELIPVYNIEVQDNHNYIVGGNNGILVHNCGLQVKQFREKFGVIEHVSDKPYVSNSFHCHVSEQITPIQKQDLEGQFWDTMNGGKIQYVKYPISYNLEAVKVLVRRAMSKGFYEGVNLALSYCDDCGYEQLDMDICPKCGSRNLTKIDRMNGYLAYSRVKGDSRLADHKMEEIKDRVSM